MNNSIKKPAGWMDTAISTRPKPRKPIIICKEPQRAIAIMNKKYGANRFPIGQLPFKPQE